MFKDKSGVGIIIDYSRLLHCCGWRLELFSIFFSFNLRNYIFQSVKKFEMKSFCMTSLQVDLNEAAKYADIAPPTLLASLSRLRTLVHNTKWR